MNKKWRIYNTLSNDVVKNLQKELNIDLIIAKMLQYRGINTKKEALDFFNPSLENLHDPFLMKGMTEAVAKLEIAIKQNQKILIYGDYDVDGTTSVALMFNYLKNYTQNIQYYIPDRYDEGYGLSKKAIDFAHKNDFNLIITLDCGIKAVENIDYGKKHGIDFIVCDHHTPGEILPDAIILDPKQKGCEYPYKELCGCGVGFKLLSGLCQKNDAFSSKKLMQYLDLLAIAIGADIVPITGENRTLCHFGLAQLNEKPRLGIAKLLELAKRPIPLTLTDVVFVIAPRINAAGRMLHAKKAVELLISNDINLASELAETIHESNTDRKKTDEEITNLALKQIELDEKHQQKCTNVVFGEGWHKGVVGIVASRVIENSYRPTVVLTQPEENGLLTGSARSIDGVDIYEALNNCSDLFEKFGGHTHAAGLSLKRENLEEFKSRFDDEVRKQLSEDTLIPEQKIESNLDFSQIYKPGEPKNKIPRFKTILQHFEPHGPGNMKPVFCAENVYVSRFRKLKEVHFKVWLRQPETALELEGIIFNRPDLESVLTDQQPVNIAFTLEVNEWKGRKTLQLNIKDLRPEVCLVGEEL